MLIPQVTETFKELSPIHRTNNPLFFLQEVHKLLNGPYDDYYFYDQTTMT